MDYRDLGDDSFDKIVSVGMFEHVGRSHLPEYFAQTYRLLKPGGLFLNHGISRRAGTGSEEQGLLQKLIVGKNSFSQRYIFPDGELEPVSEVNVMAENAGFEVRDVENFREHYALTLRNWVARLAAHREQAIKVSDEVTYRTWRLYMSASAYGFEFGQYQRKSDSAGEDDSAGEEQRAAQPGGLVSAIVAARKTGQASGLGSRLESPRFRRPRECGDSGGRTLTAASAPKPGRKQSTKARIQTKSVVFEMLRRD